MRNPLVELTDLVSKPGVKTYIGRVISVDGNRVHVSLSSGVLKSVWGTDIVPGTTVLIKGDTVIARVSAEDTTTVVIA